MSIPWKGYTILFQCSSKPILPPARKQGRNKIKPRIRTVFPLQNVGHAKSIWFTMQFLYLNLHHIHFRIYLFVDMPLLWHFFSTQHKCLEWLQWVEWQLKISLLANGWYVLNLTVKRSCFFLKTSTLVVSHSFLSMLYYWAKETTRSTLSKLTFGENEKPRWNGNKVSRETIASTFQKGWNYLLTLPSPTTVFKNKKEAT